MRDKNDKNKRRDEDMSTETSQYPKSREEKITKALKEVEMIESGKISKKSARDFLKESRRNK